MKLKDKAAGVQALLDQHYKDSDSYESAINDLLADMRHFCDLNGIDFFGAVTMSYQFYCREKQDPDLQ